MFKLSIEVANLLAFYFHFSFDSFNIGVEADYFGLVLDYLFSCLYILLVYAVVELFKLFN